MKIPRVQRSVVLVSAAALLLAACAADGTDDEGTTEEVTTDDEGTTEEVTDDAASDDEGDAGSFEDREFTVAVGVGETHPFYRGAVDFFSAELEERSGGAFTTEVFPEGQLGGLTESLTMMNAGTADVTLTVTSYHPPEMPLMQGLNVPRGLDGPQALHAMWTALYTDGVLQEEMRNAGCVPIIVSSTSGYEVVAAGFKPTDPASLEGRLLRTAGPIMEQAMAELGASGVETTTAEQYEGLQRGTIDGTITYPSSAAPRSLYEVADYMTLGANLFVSPGTNMCMATSVWDELDDDAKQLIYEVGREASIEVQRNVESQDEEAIELFTDAGVEIVHWGDDYAAELEVAYEGLEAWWASQVEGDVDTALSEIHQAVDAATSADDPWDLPDLGPWSS